MRNYFRSNNDICDADADVDADVIEGKLDTREALPFCFCCI